MPRNAVQRDILAQLMMAQQGQQPPMPNQVGPTTISNPPFEGAYVDYTAQPSLFGAPLRGGRSSPAQPTASSVLPPAPDVAPPPPPFVGGDSGSVSGPGGFDSGGGADNVDSGGGADNVDSFGGASLGGSSVGGSPVGGSPVGGGGVPTVGAGQSQTDVRGGAPITADPIRGGVNIGEVEIAGHPDRGNLYGEPYENFGIQTGTPYGTVPDTVLGGTGLGNVPIGIDPDARTGGRGEEQQLEPEQGPINPTDPVTRSELGRPEEEQQTQQQSTQVDTGLGVPGTTPHMTNWSDVMNPSRNQEPDPRGPGSWTSGPLHEVPTDPNTVAPGTFPGMHGPQSSIDNPYNSYAQAPQGLIQTGQYSFFDPQYASNFDPTNPSPDFASNMADLSAQGFTEDDISGFANDWGVSLDSAAALAAAGFNGVDFTGLSDAPGVDFDDTDTDADGGAEGDGEGGGSEGDGDGDTD